MLLETAILLAMVTVLFLRYFNGAFKFWKEIHIYSLKPVIPFGNLGNPFTRKETIGVTMKNMYQQLKLKGYKHAGFYSFARPEYLPIDLELIKNILQKDFQYFTERGFYYNERDDPLSAHLFAIGGQKWRNLRTKLTPTFTSGKMKMMFHILVQCSHQMLEAMHGFNERKETIDIKDVLARYTTDVIGSCAFGLECNSFKSPDAEFRKYGKKIFERFSYFPLAKMLIAFLRPELAKKLRITITDKEVSNFFINVVKNAVNYRETNKVDFKDMLQLLINLRNETSDKNENNQNISLTIEEVAAQAYVFFIAGFETSSTTMTFCLYELAKNQEIQQKLREEINQVLTRHGRNITYDSVMEMKYMGQVIDETLRKYPPLPFITRKSVSEYKVPDTDVIIPKDISTNISIMGIHHDPEYYPDPEKFNPERFSDAEKQNRHPFSFIPFGEGPRICIGLRFGLMQTKVGLATLLRSYKFSLNQMTVDPLVFDPFVFILTSEKGIFLDIEKA